MKIKGHIDSHNHLAKVLGNSPDLLEQWLPEAEAKGIGFFMQGGIDPDDWNRQIELRQRRPDQIGLCFGVHPYFAASKTVEELEPILDQLARLLGQHQKTGAILAVGETGLDFRPAYTEKGRDSQIHALEAQIELADWTGLPLVFHIVQAHPEVERIFSVWAPKNKRGLIHSYSGTIEQSEFWTKQGLLISIGGPVCHTKNKKARKVAKHVPLEFLCLETDSPDQPPPAYNKGENPPKSLLDVAKTIGELRNLDAEEILAISNRNFLRVFAPDKNGKV
jgi:TatD DNase family protein